jgi:AmmeMemoRadiSam system protein A
MIELFQQLPFIARTSITQYFHKQDEPPPCPYTLINFKAGIFVTLYTQPKTLRGCVGTIEPYCENVWRETWQNARSSAFSDSRFLPLTQKELINQIIEVSVLHPSEKLNPDADLDSTLDPECYGIIVTANSGRRALLLPDIDGVNTWQEQVQICRRKGNMTQEEPISIARFKVDKLKEQATF